MSNTLDAPLRPIPARDLEAIRSQHRCLHALVPQFLLAESAGTAAQARKALLDTAMALMDRHFRLEERVLRAIGHPTLADQRVAHRAILSGLFELQQRVLRGVALAPAEMSHALDAFLVHDVLDDQVFPPPRRISRALGWHRPRGDLGQTPAAGLAAQGPELETV